MTAHLSIRALHLHADTSRGRMGHDLVFGHGLNLIRADNSSGKSTTLMGILYALGLEGMLGPSGRVPLAHAMTDLIEVNGAPERVLRSAVAVEIANGAGEIITVSRMVTHPDISRNLVKVELGPALTAPGAYVSADYFVRRSGSAQNEAGFHRFIAEFLSLPLPRVTRLDGSEVPLYLETVFPYFFVEQKHGWSSIQARIPTHLGIRDVHKRTSEFVLGLGALDRVRQRQLIKSNLAELETRWQGVFKSGAELARLSQVVLSGGTARISKGLSDDDFVPTVVVGGAWESIDAALTSLETELGALTTTPATVGEAATQIEESLSVLESQLRETLVVAAALSGERSEHERELEQVGVRLEALREDLQRHKDSEVLRRLGSQHAHTLLADRICPTCHQGLEDGADIAQHTMSAAENIEFIGKQITTFEATGADLTRVLVAMKARENALLGHARQLRIEIRASRDALTSANATPSVADVAHRLTLENRIVELRARREEFATLRDEMQQIAADWSRQKAQLDAIGTDDLSLDDRARLAALQTSMRSQLSAYGFQSLAPEEIEVDPNSYRPTHEGFDLGFDLSASDMIRVIWAYLFGLLNVSRMHGGNHLGLLIFDEPRQQDTARASYAQLLAHAAGAGAAGSQVIFATSEPLDSLQTLLGDAPYTLLNLNPGEKLLRFLGPVPD